MASQLSDYPKSNLTSLKKRQLKNQRYNNKKKLLLENNDTINNDRIVNEDTANSIDKKQYNTKHTPKMLSKCQAIKHDGSPCDKMFPHKNKYCQPHNITWKDYTSEEIILIKDNKMKNCHVCHKWHNEELANHQKCNESVTEKRNQKIIEDREKGKVCKGIMGNGKQCNSPKIVNDSGYCGTHEYQGEYTSEQKNAMIVCLICRNFKFIQDGRTGCLDCRTLKNAERREITKKKPKCNGIVDGRKCTFPAGENGFCKKHLPTDKIVRLICAGYIPKKKDGKYIPLKCNYLAQPNNKFCGKHKERFSDFSDNQLDMIGSGDATVCSHCTIWHFGDLISCEQCLILAAKYREDHKTDIVIKCKWKTRHIKDCNRIPINGTDYCDIHEYVCDYTPEMREKSKLCLGCMKFKYLENGCDKCMARARKNREEQKKNKIFCRGFIGDEKCPYKAWENCYCGNHQIQAWKNDIEKIMINQVCPNYIRGCRNIIDISRSKYIYCMKCRKGNSYYDYVRYAKKRDLEFKLTLEYYNSLIDMNCYYCNEICYKGWNGVDRFDNTKGYYIDNSVPCCMICNYMKKNHTIDNFIKICKNISENYPCVAIFEDFTPVKHMTYNDYKTNAKGRNIKFELSTREFLLVIGNKCHYCGNTNLNNQIGIDRIDSNIGYKITNVVSCCKVCNYTKNKFSLDDMIRKINAISNSDKFIKNELTNNIEIAME